MAKGLACSRTHSQKPAVASDPAPGVGAGCEGAGLDEAGVDDVAIADVAVAKEEEEEFTSWAEFARLIYTGYDRRCKRC